MVNKMSYCFINVIAGVLLVGAFVFSACDNETMPETSKKLVNVEVTPPMKVQYNLNEAFDPSGMVVTAVYDDNSRETVTGYQTNGFSSVTAGVKTIIVTYSGKSDTFTITVIDPTKETVAIPIANPPAGIYTETQQIELTTTTDFATIYYTTNGSTPTTGSSVYLGPITVNRPMAIKAIARKEGMNNSGLLEASYNIIRSIAVITLPTKTWYRLNEPLDLDGLVVEATSGDGSKEQLKITATHITGFDSTIKGSKTLTIYYFGASVSFTVNVEIITSEAGWNTALATISAETDGTTATYKVYELELSNFNIAGKTSNTISGNYKTVRLIGDGTVSLTSNGNMLRVAENQIFIVDGPTLQGHSGNNTSLVYILGGNFTLLDGSISSNTSSNSNGGGGVYISSNGTFTMKGNSTISGNASNNSSGNGGGGVFISSGAFIMYDDSSVSDNTCSIYGNGGGVYVGGGTFTMQDNTSVPGNTSYHSGGQGGGGVHIDGGIFVMQGNASVSDNNSTSTGDGGGVYLNTGTFIMQDNASVFGNTPGINGGSGGGVFVSNGTFTMQDNTSVSDNGNANGGGGVYVGRSGTFIMLDNALIYSNASSWGGGVYNSSGIFRIEGGTILGNNDIGIFNANQTPNGNGAALYGSAQRGIFNGTSFQSLGTLISTENIIRVVNGILQE